MCTRITGLNGSNIVILMFFREFIKGSAFAGGIWLSGLVVGMSMNKTVYPVPVTIPPSLSPQPVHDLSKEDARHAYNELLLGWWPSQ